MVGRANAQIAEALATLAGIMDRDHQPGREDEARLERFMKHKPPTFTGGCCEVVRRGGDYIRSHEMHR
ncbi:hypothetical protein A2U01_0093033, partial [Trifolium medium]|nr:hypothetical protein [Trifolium medium]